MNISFSDTENIIGFIFWSGFISLEECLIKKYISKTINKYIDSGINNCNIIYNKSFTIKDLNKKIYTKNMVSIDLCNLQLSQQNINLSFCRELNKMLPNITNIKIYKINYKTFCNIWESNNNIKKLKLKNCSNDNNIENEEIFFPEFLEYLTLEYYTFEKINVTNLKYFNCLHSSIQDFSQFNNLETLIYQSKLPIIKLPNNLKNLKYYSYDIELPELPDSLIDLELQLYRLDLEKLPKNLKKLKINQNLKQQKIKLPESLLYLYTLINNKNYFCKLTLPSNLKIIYR